MPYPNPYNPYAPAAYMGLSGDPAPSQPQYREDPFDYVFNTTLAANAFVQLQQTIETDADFRWKALVVTTKTGEFEVQFSDTRQYFFSNTYMHSLGLSTDPGNPTSLGGKGIVIAAGGRIGINLHDLSGAPNTIQIVFRGAKLVRQA